MNVLIVIDKDIKIKKGVDEELEKEANEFKDYIKKGKRFQIVLTNPPPSMKCSENEEDETRILKQYGIAHKNGKNKTQEIRSLKSNVLSLERYYNLLESRGKLITVIDETVLNAGSKKDFRDFIRDRFII